VENVYIEYNFSHFLIYLPQVIIIDGNLTKFWQKQFCTVFSETRCILWYYFTKYTKIKLLFC